MVIDYLQSIYRNEMQLKQLWGDRNCSYCILGGEEGLVKKWVGWIEEVEFFADDSPIFSSWE